MTGLEALQSVQFVTIEGKRLAVLSAVSLGSATRTTRGTQAEDWEAMIEWLENVEDVQIAQSAFAQLQAAGGDRAKAGWLKWDSIENEVIRSEIDAIGQNAGPIMFGEI